jgi:Protein of unknown function (DUF3592)
VESLILRCAIIIAALAPIGRRFYIERFWACARGTVVKMDLQYNATSRMPGWIWVPTIEYHVAGQRWALAKNYWQSPGDKPAYKVGDEVEILYNPRKPWRFTYKAWRNWIVTAIITGVLGLAALANLPP